MNENAPISIGCVILAAGNAVRFGKNKLLFPINEKPMIERAFEALPVEELCGVVVVTQYEEIETLAGKHGFSCLRNRCPEAGISRSVRLGTQVLMERCDGILYQVSDQPWLKRESVARMLELFREYPERIVSMSSGGKRGNPCVFPKAYFEELCCLSGDRGGRAVIERHREDLLLFEVSEPELADIDTPEDMAR